MGLYGLVLGQYMLTVINSLPKDKILDCVKLKAFADDKINLTQKLKLDLERVENISGKGENDGYHHFLLFPKCFQKPSFSGSFSLICIVIYRVNPLPSDTTVKSKLQTLADDN